VEVHLLIGALSPNSCRRWMVSSLPKTIESLS
jgi:hypothetical protein